MAEMKYMSLNSLKHYDQKIKTYVDERVASGNSDLPDSTTAEEGAFLRIVDGTWTAVTMHYAEEAVF